MKKIFIPAYYKKEIVFPKKHINRLTKKVAIFSSIQFIKSIPNIIKQLKKEGIEIINDNNNPIKQEHTQFNNQLLGCNIRDFKLEKEVSLLYIGDGMFHPKALVFKNNNPIFRYNPKEEKFDEIKKEEIKEIEKKIKIGMIKFLTSENIGVLITLKPGQHDKRYKKLKELFPKKNFYFLLDNTFNFNALEDFNFLDCYINTACKRIGLDDTVRLNKPIINIEDIFEMAKNM
jgi:2-(3-amino-3-carboxypropyl)histidine synthase